MTNTTSGVVGPAPVGTMRSDSCVNCRDTAVLVRTVPETGDADDTGMRWPSFVTSLVGEDADLFGVTPFETLVNAEDADGLVVTPFETLVTAEEDAVVRMVSFATLLTTEHVNAEFDSFPVILPLLADKGLGCSFLVTRITSTDDF